MLGFKVHPPCEGRSNALASQKVQSKGVMYQSPHPLAEWVAEPCGEMINLRSIISQSIWGRIS